MLFCNSFPRFPALRLAFAARASNAQPSKPPGSCMSSVILKWVANGLIAVVLICTLWMARTIHPEQGDPDLLLAQVAPAAAAASAPATAAR